MSAPSVCVPGERLGKVNEVYRAGHGTYVRNGTIYSTLTGFVNTVQKDDTKVIEVQTHEEQNIVPTVGSVVTARVTNVNNRFCKCAILSVESSSLREPFRGMIRREDVRATEKDKIDMYRSYRPGDIILARVHSLGDAMSYVLQTAENELGVVIATSEAGAVMVPISWCQMQCPKTHVKEFRKVAKVQPEFVSYAVQFSKP